MPINDYSVFTILFVTVFLINPTILSIKKATPINVEDNFFKNRLYNYKTNADFNLLAAYA